MTSVIRVCVFVWVCAPVLACLPVTQYGFEIEEEAEAVLLRSDENTLPRRLTFSNHTVSTQSQYVLFK